MMENTQPTTKQNVRQFDDDVRRTGSYAYTTERLSARLANTRISESIADSFDFAGKSVLDLGCGDGTYTLEFVNLGAREVIGVDPAGVAIDSARRRVEALGLSDRVRFEIGDIYSIAASLENWLVDVIVLRGVLHHLPDPPRAIQSLSGFHCSIVLMEPNGNNPVLKLLERYSRYHVKHEERSFRPPQIQSWLEAEGFRVTKSSLINLVPFFCPDWMALILKWAGPVVERTPMLRDIACGQLIIAASR